jgi:hypothetical protein
LTGLPAATHDRATLYGLAAYGPYRIVAGAGLGWLDWQREGPYMAGAAIASAGLYQLNPLKEACLRRCRGPLGYLVRGLREGAAGALRMSRSGRRWRRSSPAASPGRRSTTFPGPGRRAGCSPCGPRRSRSSTCRGAAGSGPAASSTFGSRLEVGDEELEFAFRGNCGYESDFEYAGPV